ncbi:MAG TPA: hypothetical protein VG184_12985 [Acidimicrobiales bacterium]|nr:hypothetical protein [Acidimicrobiales bacterium]
MTCATDSENLTASGSDPIWAPPPETSSTTLVPPHLHLREVLDLPDVAAATADDAEGTYLVVSVAGAAGRCWMCAPATQLAIDCVRSRRTTPWTVMHHSSTGTVQVWRARADGTLVESVKLCAHIAPGDLAA